MFSTYRCDTCGVVSDNKEGLCQPEKLANRMDYCGSGQEHGNPVCDRMDRKLAYQCFTCGRPAAVPDLVCSPTLIHGADEKARSSRRRTPFSARNDRHFHRGQD